MLSMPLLLVWLLRCSNEREHERVDRDHSLHGDSAQSIDGELRPRAVARSSVSNEPCVVGSCVGSSSQPPLERQPPRLLPANPGGCRPATRSPSMRAVTSASQFAISVRKA